MPASPESGAPSARHRIPGFDPRLLVVLVVVLVVVASAAVMGPGGLRFVPAVLLLGLGLAALERAWRRAAVLTGSAVVLWAVGWLLPLWCGGPVVAILSLSATFLIRFVAALGPGLHLLATTAPTRLAAGLRAWRTPRPIAVVLAVMLRFFPVVAAESSAVLDAMRLRGLTGTRGLVRHPILSIERFTVPMIAASLRAGEDLSAAAILRGMGSDRRPTAMDPPRFAVPDLLLALVVVVLAVTTLLVTGAAA